MEKRTDSAAYFVGRSDALGFMPNVHLTRQSAAEAILRHYHIDYGNGDPLDVYERTKQAFVLTIIPIEQMRICEIANVIKLYWQEPYFGSVPYLRAMLSLSKITDKFGDDSGSSIVAYFLANARLWKGEEARIIKAELNRRLKA